MTLPLADPDLTGRTVVFLHAHPDDEAIFTGVAMRRLADRGARVVLVTATSGEEGTPVRPLRRGERIRRRRVQELEVACDELGVDRLVLLRHRDSGMPGAPANGHRRALARQDVARVGRRLVRLLRDEAAEALVHYDPHGIYGHPDHVAVHRLGAWASGGAAVTSYEATVDRDQLRAGPRHLVEGDRPRDGRSMLGRSAAEVTTRIRATADELDAKRRAMGAHMSQIRTEVLTDAGFPLAYGREWFVRSGGPGILDELDDSDDLNDVDEVTSALSGTG